MFSVWTKHLKEQDSIERFNNSLLGSKVVLDRAKDIIKEKQDALVKTEKSLEAYNSPNWDYRQAHLNGIYEGFQYVLKLLDLDQQTKGKV